MHPGHHAWSEKRSVDSPLLFKEQLPLHLFCIWVPQGTPGSSAACFASASTLAGSFQGAAPHPTTVTNRLGLSPHRSST